MRFIRTLGGSSPLLLAILQSTQSVAMPALDTPVRLQQPDGQVFEALPVGDEWNNRMETPPGFTIARDASGVWRYVTAIGPGGAPVLASTPADRPAPPGLSKHLSAGRSRPQLALGQGVEGAGGDGLSQSGTVATSSPVLFILTEFNDQKGGTVEADWTDFVSNKVVDYYASTSHGNAALAPAADSSGTQGNGVIDWVNVGYNHPNTRGSTGELNRKLSADAIAAADPHVNFAAYDRDGNGYVDGDELSVVVIVAGYETAYGGTGGALSPSVWGHKWGWWSNFPLVDGVRITEYAQFGEYHATSLSNSHQATMGIMVHELGHLTYGLPDLYDTDGSSNGIGAFGLMAGGSWGRASGESWSGMTPVNASAWSKYVMNWVDGSEGTGAQSITASGDSGAGTAGTAVFRASSPDSNQYFLLENRQPVGYDRGLERYLGPGFTGGLAIWHIDDSRTTNASDNHRWVDLEEADNSSMTSSSGSTADLWRGVSGTAFGAATSPDSSLYDGSDSGVQVADISVSGAVMTATFGDASEPPPPPPEPPAEPSAPSAVTATDGADGTATVTWVHDGVDVTHFEIVRQKEHKKRAGSWTETVTLSPFTFTGGTEFSIGDVSGTGRFRYGIRAVNDSTPSAAWTYSNTVEITDSGGGGGGGGGNPKPCRGKNCSS